MARSHGFPRVLAAEAVSNFGAMLSRLAIPWLAALALGASPLQMSALVIADVVAGFAGSLALGVWVDRREKRAVMLAADLGRALVLGVLAGLAWTGTLAFWMLAAAAAVTGLLTVKFELARSAWMAERLAAGELDAANAKVAAATSLSETAAFALGGWLYQGLGAALALAADALSYVVSAFCLGGVARSPARAAAPAPFREDLAAGIRAVRDSRLLAALAAIEVLLALAMSLMGVSYMIYVARDLAFDPGVLGMIFATGGVGALAGAWLSPRLAASLGPRGAMTGGLAMLGAATLLLPLAAGATLMAAGLLIAHQVLGDSGHTVHAICDRTQRQLAAPPELLARVDATLRTAGFGARLAGAVAGGALATALGTRSAIALAGGLVLLAAALAWARLPSR